MRQRRHFGSEDERAAGLALPLLSMVLAVGLTGCRHNTKPFVPPQISRTPIELETLPEPAVLPEIQPVPLIATIKPLHPVEFPKPVVTRRRTTPPPPPPVQVAAADPSAAAIGSLSSGGDSTPQSQQQAKDLIASIQKRLSGLSRQTANQQKDLVRQVQTFLKQAQQALDSGDAEGAKNLAMKAKLLMDDVEKK